jgi:SAM-dependent methyltransferase
MTPYERLRIAAEPVLPVLYSKTRRELQRLLAETPARPARVLDIGGRKSPYTVGLSAEITVLDLPRESEVQQLLHLGVTDDLLAELRRRRSNIAAVTLQDMTRSELPSDEFDGAICVEVIEHVPEAEAFIEQSARVLKPGGWFYLTTPNGDYLSNEGIHHNPDHVKLYTRAEMEELLGRHFGRVRVTWGVHTGHNRTRGLHSLTWRRPLRTAGAMAGNVLSHLESRNLDEQWRRTAHLFAVAYK